MVIDSPLHLPALAALKDRSPVQLSKHPAHLSNVPQPPQIEGVLVMVGGVNAEMDEQILRRKNAYGDTIFLALRAPGFSLAIPVLDG